MKKQRLALSYLIIFCLASLVCAQSTFSQTSQPHADAVIKIVQIDKILETVDRISAAVPDQSQSSPSTFVRSMLMGTSWIDPDRAIVGGVFLKNDPAQQPDAAALIPFRKPNDDFLMNYNAVAGSDYYIISLPPGQGGMVSDRMEEALVAASLKPPDGLISLDLAASQIIAKAEPQIQNMLESLEQKVPPEDSDTDLSPKQVKQMLANLIETGKQLERVSIGLDMTEAEFAFFCNAKALEDSGLAATFDVEKAREPLILADYQPDYPIKFRSQPYDINAVMDFFDQNFAPVYEQMGVDFGKLKEMTRYFSGEMAGGASFGKDRLDLEVIAVFEDAGEIPDNYLDAVYLPWILNYGKTMAEYVSRLSPDVQVENFFERTPDSTVAGQSVAGLKGKMPVDMQTGQNTLSFQLRMTRLGNMLLTASDDQQLKTLIENAKGLEKAPAGGPLMQMDIDLAAYLEAISEFMPAQSQIDAGEIQDIGSLSYTLDLADGMLKTRYSMQRDAIQKMAAYFKELGQGTDAADTQGGQADQARQPGDSKGPEQSSAARARQADVEPDEDSPQYWLNKGELFATYGNQRRAIEHYEKALKIDPNNSKAYFHLAVSYGEVGQYEKALDAINRGIALQPEDGDYHYARGWIHSLAGSKDKAERDMQQAAELGNPDAEKYLQSIRKRYPNN
ncbi:MAG: tetratricopeptide repeat protein [Desulfobacterales bacterium]|nr:tetratricopeptide repeat protein [Desulfobacterales bacterium]